MYADSIPADFRRFSPADFRRFISFLATHRSSLTTHLSPLTTHYSPLTTHYSPLTTHYSPLSFPADSFLSWQTPTSSTSEANQLAKSEGQANQLLQLLQPSRPKRREIALKLPHFQIPTPKAQYK